MVSSVSLCAFAATLLFLAVLVAWFRRITPLAALAEGGAALAGAALFLAASAALYVAAQPLNASGLWQDAASLALVASPLGATLGLRCRGRRSMPRALFASTLALAGIVLWLILNLRGPRGGWSWTHGALVLGLAAIALASAASLGWWSKRTAMSLALLLVAPVPGWGEDRTPSQQLGTLEDARQ